MFHNISYANSRRGSPAVGPGHSDARSASDRASWRQGLEKIAEELTEVEEALAGGSREIVEDEIGDLLFAVANLARHAGVDAEAALRRANAKFERRFRAIEAALADAGRTPRQATLEEMEELWLRAKHAERQPGG